MDPRWLAVTALAFGIVVGVTFMIVLHIAERYGNRAAQVISPTVPDGVDQIIDVLGSAGLVLDPSNNILRASKSAYGLGLIRNNILTHPEVAKIAAKARQNGRAVTKDLTLPRSAIGERKLGVRVLATPIGTRYVLVLVEDRTEANRLDEIRRDFIANVSHELKTPITSVGLLAEAITEASNEPAQVQRFAERLSVEAARLARITEEIIELSRLQSKEITGAELVIIDDVVTLAVDETKVIAKAKQVQVVFKAKSEATVYGNKDLLVGAVHNLISNAVAYSAAADSIGVATKIVDDFVEISVTDRGVGIKTEDQDRVFERFYRVDQARARNTGGTGLGLSIVKHSVQNHGGDIRLWSQPGFGSTFTIRLPLAQTSDAGKKVLLGKTKTEVHQAQKPRKPRNSTVEKKT